MQPSGRRRARALRRIGARVGRGWKPALIVACVCGLALLGVLIGGKAHAPQRPATVRPTDTTVPSESPSPASSTPDSSTPDSSSPWPVSPALGWPAGRTK